MHLLSLETPSAIVAMLPERLRPPPSLPSLRGLQRVELAQDIGREIVALARELDDAPQTARHIRAGGWDDTQDVRDAVVAIRVVLELISPECEPPQVLIQAEEG